jgi:hypothetical protein
MEIDVVRSDRDRGFADWGVTVVLRRVSQSFDPETGVLSETYEDRDVPAIVGDGELAAVVGTAGHAGRLAQRFLVRSEDVEEEGSVRTMRVVHGGREYRVDDVEGWPQGRMTLLKCRAV